MVQGGIAHVQRFSVGTANFDATDLSCGYGNQIVTAPANLG
ncbi:hypothetical protein [Streptomyces sp. CC228A]|nr:hypothetical protein [Streptomyces sp. CC228A]